MRIATWNVNSIRARMPRVEGWLEEWKPDLLCVQETKVRDEEFPIEPFTAIGYKVAFFGQKTYNGVALIAREEPADVFRALPDDPEDADRRVISGRIGKIRVINVYAPNGTELGSPRFEYKLEWFRRLRACLEGLGSPEDPLLLCGDINIAPDDRDVYDPDGWRGKLLFHPDEHKVLRELMDWGLTDAFRLKTDEGGHYSWWDYRGGMFHKGNGLRIDLILVTKPLEPRVQKVTIDREARKGEKPSDHAPVVIDLS